MKILDTVMMYNQAGWHKVYILEDKIYLYEEYDGSLKEISEELYKNLYWDTKSYIKAHYKK